MKKLIKESGVTLVALVITIIVLLILAGITINLTIGQDGIISKAQQAGKNYLNAQEYEELQMAELTNQMQNILNNGTGVRNSYDESTFRASVIKAIQEAGVDTPDDATDETIISNIGKISVGESSNQLLYIGRNNENNANQAVEFAYKIFIDNDYISYNSGVFTMNKKCTAHVLFDGTVTNNNNSKVIRFYLNDTLNDSLSGTNPSCDYVLDFEAGDTFYFYQLGSEYNRSVCSIYIE